MKRPEETRPQMNMWQTPNDGLMKRLSNSSNRQREEAMKFLMACHFCHLNDISYSKRRGSYNVGRSLSYTSEKWVFLQ